jgi:hypothetical protein
MSFLESSAEHETRYWCICLLASMEVAGFVPAPRERIHSLFFLTNALAPAYGDAPQIGVVMNHPRGPYYPEVDWHLSRLSLQGAVAVSNLRFYKDTDGAWQSSNFRITSRGASQVGVLQTVSLWSRRFQFLSDVCSGLARIDTKRVNSAVRSDDTYSRPGARNHDMHAFGQAESNYTIRRLSRLRDAAPAGLAFSRQDLIRTYATLLNLQVS